MGCLGAHRRAHANWRREWPIAFARHGGPDNPTIPEWPAYTQAERATKVFDDECRPQRTRTIDAAQVAGKGARLPPYLSIRFKHGKLSEVPT